jgi:hypothetical protein
MAFLNFLVSGFLYVYCSIRTEYFYEISIYVIL